MGTGSVLAIVIAGLLLLFGALLLFCPGFFTAFERPRVRRPLPTPAPEYVAFNLNDAIKVKLSGEGFEKLKGMPYDGVKDADGYFEFRAWEFLGIFGAHVFVGNDLFDANILIRSKDITEVKKSTF